MPVSDFRLPDATAPVFHWASWAHDRLTVVSLTPEDVTDALAEMNRRAAREAGGLPHGALWIRTWGPRGVGLVYDRFAPTPEDPAWLHDAWALMLLQEPDGVRIPALPPAGGRAAPVRFGRYADVAATSLRWCADKGAQTVCSGRVGMVSLLGTQYVAAAADARPALAAAMVRVSAIQFVRWLTTEGNHAPAIPRPVLAPLLSHRQVWVREQVFEYLVRHDQRGAA